MSFAVVVVGKKKLQFRNLARFESSSRRAQSRHHLRASRTETGTRNSMSLMILANEVLNVHQLVVKMLKTLLSSWKAGIMFDLIVLDQCHADVFLKRKKC